MKGNSLLELEVTYKPVGTLAVHPHNARTHSQHQIRQIAASIKAFGFTSPVLVDQNDTVIAGHGRVAAAKLLGMDQVPTIRLNGLTVDQVRAYVIADNRIAEKAGWDNSILAIELQHLLTIDSNLDVTITGFEIPEIDLLLSQAVAEPDPDDIFEIDQTNRAVTKAGDVWVLGKHRVLCGNALDENCYRALMVTRRANVVFVDPPYNLPIEGNVSGHGSIHHPEFAMASGEMNAAEFVAFLSTSSAPVSSTQH